MNERLLARLPDSYTVRAESLVDGRSWIQVMPVVSEARNGRWFQTITEDDLKTYAESIREKSAATWTIAIDRDHGGDTSNPDLRDTRAAGWFTGKAMVLTAGEFRPDTSETEAAGPELWAEVKWTPKAIQEIQDGEYRFVSPTYTFKQRDPKTGLLTKAKEIIAATLTNRPFFDMAPVTAAVVWTPEEGFRHIQEEVEAALNQGTPPGQMSRYWVMDVAAEKALVRESGGESRTWVVPFTRSESGVQISPQTEWAEAEEEWVEVAQSAIEAQIANSQGASSAHDEGDQLMDLKAIAAKLGLSEDADEAAVTAAIDAANAEKEQLEAKVGELEAKSTDDPSEIEQLKTSLANTQAKLDDAECEKVLGEAIDEGKLAPAAKEALAEQFKGNMDGLKAVLTAMPAGVVRLEAKGSGGDKQGELDTKASEEKIKAGEDKPVDGLDLVARAEKILTDQGKTPSGEKAWTEDEYATALDQAEREAKVAA